MTLADDLEKLFLGLLIPIDHLSYISILLSARVFNYSTICLVSPSICLSICLSILSCISLEVAPFVCLLLHPSACMAISQPTCMSVCPSIHYIYFKYLFVHRLSAGSFIHFV